MNVSRQCYMKMPLILIRKPFKKRAFSLLGSVGIKSLKFFFATDDIAACFLAVVTLKMAPAFVF